MAATGGVNPMVSAWAQDIARFGLQGWQRVVTIAVMGGREGLGGVGGLAGWLAGRHSGVCRRRVTGGRYENCRRCGGWLKLSIIPVPISSGTISGRRCRM